MPLPILKGNSDAPQIYYEWHLYYQTRPNYWKCIDPLCHVTLKTVKNDDQFEINTPPTLRHIDNSITNQDFLCRCALKKMKERIYQQTNLFPRTIYDEEIARLITEHQLERNTIMTYLKDYSYYQSTFEKIRAKVRPKLLISNSKKRKRSFLKPDCDSSDVEENNENSKKQDTKDETLEISSSNSSIHHKQLTINDEKLNFDSIMVALNNIHQQFPQIGGLIDVALFQRDENIEFDLKINEKSVFVIWVNRHWVTLTNINEFKPGTWLLYDSLNNVEYLKALKPIFRRISKFEKRKGRFSVCTINVPTQKGDKDCGLFALAYVIELCHSRNPGNFIYEQSQMRNHFNNCVVSGNFLNFPSINNNVKLNYSMHQLNLGLSK